jgi:hypothetical protein
LLRDRLLRLGALRPLPDELVAWCTLRTNSSGKSDARDVTSLTTSLAWRVKAPLVARA